MNEFHQHGQGHSHGAGSNERSLTIALVLTTIFLLVELVGGVVTQSLALISDAAHMFTDTAALAIGLAAIRIAKRAADRRRTFGYHRFEILAAAFNAMLLFSAAIYIIYEAYLRLKAPPEIQSTGMLVIAIIGLAVNLASMRVLSAGQASSLNMKGAYLEVWADMLGSVGVIVEALMIKFTGWVWVDSAVAILIGLWVVPRTWTLLKSSVNILLEGVPDDVDLDAVTAAIHAVPGVVNVHDLHVWALTTGKTSLTVHVVHEPSVTSPIDLITTLQTRINESFEISHVTIQCELTPCHQANGSHDFSGTEGLQEKHAH